MTRYGSVLILLSRASGFLSTSAGSGSPFQVRGSANLALVHAASRHFFQVCGLSVQETPIFPSLMIRIIIPEPLDLLPIAILSCFRSADIDSILAKNTSASSATLSAALKISSINIAPPDYRLVQEKMRRSICYWHSLTSLAAISWMQGEIITYEGDCMQSL